MAHQFKSVAAAVTLAVTSSGTFAFGTGNMPTVPSGWTIREQYQNVLIYEKNGVFVQVVDVKNGAKVRFNYRSAGTVKFPSGYIGSGYWKQQISDFWSAVSYDSRAISVVNGQFFATDWNPSIFSYGVKADGTLVDYGSDKNAYRYYPRQIEFTDGLGVRIMAWDENRLKPGGSSAQNIIVGLNTSEDKKSSQSIGRTYMCTLKPSPSPWFAVFVAKQKTQAQMMSMTSEWGCYGTIMMDGSGSSQMITRGGNSLVGSANPIYYQPDYRALAMGIYIYNN
jgi:hypothetical protein